MVVTDALGITIGSDDLCGLVVDDDPYISKVHAKVFVRDGRLVIEDQGSTNGTWINGVKVWVHVLDAGADVVRLGHTEWTVTELIDAIRARFHD